MDRVLINNVLQTFILFGDRRVILHLILKRIEVNCLTFISPKTIRQSLGFLKISGEIEVS